MMAKAESKAGSDSESYFRVQVDQDLTQNHRVADVLALESKLDKKNSRPFHVTCQG